MAVDEVNDQVGVLETTWIVHNEVASVHRCRGPFETTVPPDSSIESSDSQSADRYSQYSLLKDTSSQSSSFSSSESDGDACSDCSYSPSYYQFSYYDYDNDGGYDWKKMKNGGNLFDPHWNSLFLLVIVARILSPQ